MVKGLVNNLMSAIVAEEMINYNPLIGQLLQIEILIEDFHDEILHRCRVEWLEQVTSMGLEFSNTIKLSHLSLDLLILSHCLNELTIKVDDNHALLLTLLFKLSLQPHALWNVVFSYFSSSLFTDPILELLYSEDREEDMPLFY